MRKNKRLSDLLFDKPMLVIKDREMLLSIYEEYLQGHFIHVVNMIIAYGDFEFFRDMLIFLNDKYQSETHKIGIYSHLTYLYFEEFRL
jgi:hypothetical protein